MTSKERLWARASFCDNGEVGEGDGRSLRWRYNKHPHTFLRDLESVIAGQYHRPDMGGRQEGKQGAENSCLYPSLLLELLQKRGMALFDLDRQDQRIIEELTKNMWAIGQDKLSSFDMSVQEQMSGWDSCGPQTMFQDQSASIAPDVSGDLGSR